MSTLLDRLAADFKSAFEKIDTSIQDAINEEREHSRMMDRRIGEAMRKSREGCTLDTDNSYDGDGGRNDRDERGLP